MFWCLERYDIGTFSAIKVDEGIENMKYAAAAAMVIASSGALAGFDADFTGLFGRIDAIRVDTTGHGGTLNETFNAGQFLFDYTDMGGDRGIGQFAGGSFATFCIELQDISAGSSSYDIGRVSDAPNPSAGGGQGPYDSADEAEVSAVLAAAVSLGWLNWDLSATGSLDKDQAAAIQGMIWKVIFDNADVSAETAAVAAQMAILESVVSGALIACRPSRILKKTTNSRSETTVATYSSSTSKIMPIAGVSAKASKTNNNGLAMTNKAIARKLYKIWLLKKRPKL